MHRCFVVPYYIVQRIVVHVLRLAPIFLDLSFHARTLRLLLLLPRVSRRSADLRYSMTALPFIPPFCAYALALTESGRGNPWQPSPLRTAEVDDDLAYRWMEEGLCVVPRQPRNQPTVQRTRRAARNSAKILIRVLLFNFLSQLSVSASLSMFQLKEEEEELTISDKIYFCSVLQLLVALEC